MFGQTHRQAQRERLVPLQWFESLLWGISSGFPLANHLALPGSESIFEVVLVVKNLPTSSGEKRDWVRSLGLEDSLEEGMATHSGILAQRIPWTEKPGWLYHS